MIEAGACGTGASWQLNSASAMRALTSASGAQLDGVDQPLKDVAEQLDLFVAVAAGRRQKQRGHALGGLGAFFGGACGDRRFDLVGDR